MRFLTLGSAALLLAACSGGGDTDSPTTGTATGGGNTPPDCDSGEVYSDTADACVTQAPPCLDINVLTMDMEFGWDGTQVVEVGLSDGSTIESYFQMNFGPPGWTGDTSLPGPPDNWCFVRWDLDGTTNSAQGAEYAAIYGLGAGISNCGQESSPGANDMVDLCDASFFGGYDPADYWAGPEWQFATGGVDIDPQLADFPSYFEPYGYTADNFWGGELRNEYVFGPDPIGTIAYGLKTDANGILILDANNEPERWTSYEHGAGSLQPGYYVNLIPWIFTFN